MQYAILCYHSEDVVCSWTKEEDDAVMAKLAPIQGKWAKAGKLGPVARLMPTTTASTVRKGAKPLVLDGPFAETKEQMLGFYLFDFDTLEEVISAARELVHEPGCMEIRPVQVFFEGALKAAAAK